MSSQPLAHETWFVHSPESYPLDWSALVAWPTVVGLVLVLGVTVLWRQVALRLRTPELSFLQPLGRFAEWAPRLLALHLGASLLWLSWRGDLLGPGTSAGAGVVAVALVVPQVVAAVLLLSGRAVRVAAWLVVAAGPVVLALAGWQALVTNLVLLGTAGFLLVMPPDPARGGRARLDRARLAPALLLLRLGTAGTLIALAVVEKLANPDMAVALLEQQPVLNLLAPLGVSATTFALVAGLVEVLFGLLVLSGAAPQVVALVAAVPFTASLALFGGTELVGHLPVYGVLLTLLLLGSRAATAPEVRRLPSLHAVG